MSPRTPLTRDRVLRAAIELADRNGLDALTMRRLGAELGVQAMSLYKHVASKDEILDGWWRSSSARSRSQKWGLTGSRR